MSCPTQVIAVTLALNRVESNVKNKLELKNSGLLERKKMDYTKWTLIIVGLIVLVMGVWGLVGTYAGVTDPQWHAALKIVVGLVAVAVGFMAKRE
jgi:uncharacterized membrane protein